MFKNPRIKRWMPLAIFFVSYSLGFVLFVQTLSFTFPFLIGLLVAVLLQPLYRLLSGKLRLRPALASFLSVLAAVLLLGGVLFAFSYMLVSESSALIGQITDLLTTRNGQPSEIMQWVQEIVKQAGQYLENIDASFLSKNQQQLTEVFTTGLNIAQIALNTVLNILSSIPAVFTMLLVSVFSTYFFTKDYTRIKARLGGLLSGSAVSHVRKLWSQGGKMLSQYLRSYLMIYFLTFVETLILFLALGVPYPLVLSILSGIADIFPIIGPGTIYIPVAVLFLLNGDLVTGIALLIGWLVISAIRQVVEPKIVSASIDVHPLAMLAVIFIGLKAASFWLMIYLTALLVLYKMLVRVEILRPIFSVIENKQEGSGKKTEPEPEKKSE